MNADTLIVRKKQLGKLQKQLGRELVMGKYRDSAKIIELKKEIKNKKLEIGDITKRMIMQIDAE